MYRASVELPSKYFSFSSQLPDMTEFNETPCDTRSRCAYREATASRSDAGDPQGSRRRLRPLTTIAKNQWPHGGQCRGQCKESMMSCMASGHGPRFSEFNPQPIPQSPNFPSWVVEMTGPAGASGTARICRFVGINGVLQYERAQLICRTDPTR